MPPKFLNKNIKITDKRLKYLLLQGIVKLVDVRIGKRKGVQKVISIGDRHFTYNPDKLTKTLSIKLEQLTKDNHRYVLTEAVESLYKRTKVKNLLLKRYRPTTTETKSAFKKYTNSYTITDIKLKGMNGLSYFTHQYDKLEKFLDTNPNMIILIIVYVRLLETNADGDDVIKIKPVKSRKYTVHNKDELKDSLNNMAEDINSLIEIAKFHKSNLRVDGIESIEINYSRYNPTRGGSYIELPEWIALKKACINIKNKDNKCFKYCILCAVYEIYKKRNSHDMYHYNKLKDDIINWNHMAYPAGNRDIDRFEESNRGLISVNVYEECKILDGQCITIHRRTKVMNAKYHINLLKIVDDNGKFHYVYIKDYDRLIGSQTNKSNNKLYHCNFCQHGFARENLLQRHLTNGCLAVTGQSVKLPNEGETLSFNNHYRKFKCPFVAYADFECNTTKMEGGSSSSTSNVSSTIKYQEHTPTGFKINVVNSISETTETFIYRGVDCMDVFFNKMKEIEDNIMKILKTDKEIELTEQDKQDFDNATKCYLCNDDITTDDKKGGKVRDHCHITGKYRGCAHNVCNLNYNYKNIKIPVFFHNLKNYDSHLIVSNAHKSNCKKKIDVIALNSEKFISIGFDHILYKDSLGFLPLSLERLVKLNKYINIDGQEVLRQNWQDNFKFSKQGLASGDSPYVKSDYDLDLLTEKGVYPYDYMDGFERFNETSLPPKEAFYSKLTNEHLSDADYERAQIVWKHFKIKNMGEYHDLYLMTDVLLLSDVFENFRNMCLDCYGLDPAHYYTLPNFAWDAMLLKTGIVLEQLHDLEMYEMIESGLRGGMVQVSKKYVKANNKYMDSFDEDIVSSYINYLDANNLYGKAMVEKLPTSGFKWCDDIKGVDDILNYKNEDIGYFLEVDLAYPKELHDLHSDYPLAPQNMSVTADMISDFSKELYNKYHGGNKILNDEKGKKLILNFLDKTKYVVHIRNLKYYLEKGLILTKIHRCIKFNQSEWLEPWIGFNTDKRTKATNDFEKDLFKLMNNAVFGKTMEDVRGHCDFELVCEIKRLEKCLNNPTLKHCHIINENLVGVEKIKNVVKLNKPIYLGMAILDLSKLHMYKFFYDVLKPLYGDKIRLVYTDTDSFVIYTETEDIYEDT